ncbi:MAG: hypothetical protein HYV38_01570 [Candidatus Levybacteria bacterium]|nr:hypothetical protein [Candidatus Levybacteria bacterium]
MGFFRRNYGLILILILSFWAIRPLFTPGFFPIHDDTQVARIFEMGKMLKSGVFPVRWVPDLGYGYGYPIFNFYAPLAYYAGGIFMLLGFDALLATKIMMALGVVLAGLSMYLLAKEFFGKLGGLISGLFYVYAPYHAVDIYVRGDVAEFYAYAFIPIMFLGIYKKSILMGSIGFAAIILSHNLTAMMVTPFLLVAILINYYVAFKEKKSFIINPSSLILVLGLALSAFYWIPALLEMKNTNVLSQIGGGADFRDHFVCIPQLWDSLWGFGGSVAGCIDGLSFKIGKLHIIGSLTALILMFIAMRNKNYNNYRYYILLVFAGFLISVFLMLDVSRFVWEAIPIMAFFQYSWRFLILASFFSSLLAGYIIWFLKKPATYLSAIILIFFLLFYNLKLFNPQAILSKTSEDYTSKRSLKWVASKISDEFLPPNFNKPKSEYEVSKKPLPFTETNAQKISNLISFIGVLTLVVGIIVRYGTNKR